MFDPVQKPKHYNVHPSGLEVIYITEHFSFCVGNALKYVMRCDHKGSDVQDLQKAIWYLKRAKLTEGPTKLLPGAYSNIELYLKHEPADSFLHAIIPAAVAGMFDNAVRVIENEIKRRETP